ncbi:hypothetical protein Poli38472_000274 [Pythium oligandrum]|uniref:Uncharacterized protein n=1 Tax=Pythium oligandrum TaxID=41045 RepID=A0A8K1CBM8_PYTOL|nr:hypothetical protein Poli38472_000274 [Pythium oligandrum]|eukprot:TMW60232.1 hypothetical protein Poli38472_000274 [Pythium oligandrum]
MGTIYVFAQQNQPQTTPAGGQRRGAPVGPPGQAVPQLAANAIATASLTEKQMKLHRSLPSRNGARTITICVDALLRNKTWEMEWVNEDTPKVLADLLFVGDVYLLCKVDGDDKAVTERIQHFITSCEVIEASLEASKKRGLQSHKILFCTTTVGKVAFVRQLEPQVHVEVDPSVVRDLEKHVPRIIHVVPRLESPPASGMHHVTDSFSVYFDMLSAM